MAVESLIAKAEALREQLGRVIVGQERVIEEALVALFAGGHVLLEGPPGTAKTLLVRSLATAVQGAFRRLQFTPDVMPADIVGVNIYRAAEGRFEFQRGPLFCDLLLGDEINRAPAKTQSALLEAMQEGQASVDGVVHRLSRVFTVFATQNPIEFEGTYPLPEAQLDRFMFKTVVGYPAAEEEQRILERHQEGLDTADVSTFGISACLSTEELHAMRQEIRRLHVSAEIIRYITQIVRSTRDFHALTLGASPRASVMLLAAARAMAVLRGRDFVTPDDVRDLAAPVLRHRVVLQPEMEIAGTSADDCIQQILQRVEVPRIQA